MAYDSPTTSFLKSIFDDSSIQTPLKLPPACYDKSEESDNHFANAFRDENARQLSIDVKDIDIFQSGHTSARTDSDSSNSLLWPDTPIEAAGYLDNHDFQDQSWQSEEWATGAADGPLEGIYQPGQDQEEQILRNVKEIHSYENPKDQLKRPLSAFNSIDEKLSAQSVVQINPEDHTETAPNTTQSQGGPNRKKRKARPPKKNDERIDFLEKNRQAAVRCRQRKKQQTSSLEIDVQLARNKSLALEAEYFRLVEEVTTLREAAKLHGINCWKQNTDMTQQMESMDNTAENGLSLNGQGGPNDDN